MIMTVKDLGCFLLELPNSDFIIKGADVYDKILSLHLENPDPEDDEPYYIKLDMREKT